MFHTACTLWFFGLPGSGKTTLAKLLSEKIKEKNKSVFILDGDELRKGLNNDLGFTANDRTENIRRATEITKLLRPLQDFILATFITPLESDRELVRKILSKENCKMIFVDATLKACIKRDPKGMYARALKGELKNFTGIDGIFEIPTLYDLRLQTDKISQEECIDEIMKL